MFGISYLHVDVIRTAPGDAFGTPLNRSSEKMGLKYRYSFMLLRELDGQIKSANAQSELFLPFCFAHSPPTSAL